MPFLLSPIGNSQLSDANGAPLSGGKLFWYTAGTTTATNTYTDNTGVTPQANPVILSTLGQPANPIWLQSGVTYKVVVKDSADVLIRTIDNIAGINDIAGSLDQWVTYGNAATFISATSFSVVGDQTLIFTQWRRVKSTNTAGVRHSTILSATFGGGVTTVVVANDSGTLDSGLVAVSYGLISSTNTADPTNSGTHRSCIINGGMGVDQRNAGASQTFTAAAALAYAVDMWYGYCTGANATGQRVAGSGNTRYRYQFTGAASVSAIGFGHRVESDNAYPLAGKTCMLSVDLANSLLTTVTWTAYYANSANAFGTLGAPTRTQIATGTFTVTSTVTRYGIGVSVPSAATTGIEIVFTVGAQVSGTWTIGNVQLKEGVEVPFEVVSQAVEFARCQRHYEALNVSAGGAASTNMTTTAKFQVAKFAAPTITRTGNWISANEAGTTTSTITTTEFAAVNPTVGALSVGGVYTAAAVIP